MDKVVRPAEDDAAATRREAVIRALDNCYDPCCRERKISVVDMGLIESIEIRHREVRIEPRSGTPSGP